ALAVVGLHQGAESVGLAVDLDQPRGAAGTALVAVADHAVAAADVAFGNGAASCCIQRSQGVGLGYMLTVNVVDHPVVGLGHYRHGPEVLALPEVGVLADRPARGCMVDDADTVRVGDAQRTDEVAAVLDPVRAGHLAVAVERVETRPHRLRLAVAAARQDGGDAGLDAPATI